MTGWNLFRCGRAGRRQEQKREDIEHVQSSASIVYQ